MTHRPMNTAPMRRRILAKWEDLETNEHIGWLETESLEFEDGSAEWYDVWGFVATDIFGPVAWLPLPGDEDSQHDPRVAALVEALPRLGLIATFLPDAVAAAEKAMRKYPQPNYVITKWAEETGEVTKALVHAAEGRETWDNLRGEIVQSLAMLHRLIVEGDQVHGLPPLQNMMADAAMKGGEA